MDLADLQLLQAVAERGSFSAAAAALRLSQPAVSARVAAVERSIGARLFIRDSRGARLTPAGARYLAYAARAVRLLADGARAASAESPRRGWTIGLPASYAPALASLLLSAAADLGQPISLRTGHSRQLRDQVSDGLLDLAITIPGPLPTDLTSRHLVDTAVIAIAAPEPTPPDRYAIHSWANTGVEAVVTELLGRGLPRSRISLVSPATTALALAEHHGRIAVVPRLAALEQLAAGTLVVRSIGLPRLRTSLEWVQPSTLPSDSPLTELFRRVHRRLHRSHKAD
jgi:DNA-binding transcriptional LysR family regulator